MLQNAYFLAKIGADTAQNELHFAEILPIGRRDPAPEVPEAPALPQQRGSRKKRRSRQRKSGGEEAREDSRAKPERLSAVGPALTVWYFFLLLLHFGKIPKKFGRN